MEVEKLYSPRRTLQRSARQINRLRDLTFQQPNDKKTAEATLADNRVDSSRAGEWETEGAEPQLTVKQVQVSTRRCMCVCGGGVCYAFMFMIIMGLRLGLIVGSVVWQILLQCALLPPPSLSLSLLQSSCCCCCWLCRSFRLCY